MLLCGCLGSAALDRRSRSTAIASLTASLRRAVNGEMKMNEQGAKLETAESDLKQLMADVFGEGEEW